MKKNVMDTLRERGFIKQTVFEEDLYKLLGSESVPFYIGFDPTADSLHAVSYTHLCDGENEQSGLLAGHSHALGVPDEIVEAGTKENATSICIFDETGKDVTGNYAVAYRKGTLTVTRRPVVIETAGNSWVYDGKLHTDLSLIHIWGV